MANNNNKENNNNHLRINAIETLIRDANQVLKQGDHLLSNYTENNPLAFYSIFLKTLR